MSTGSEQLYYCLNLEIAFFIFGCVSVFFSITSLTVQFAALSSKLGINLEKDAIIISLNTWAIESPDCFPFEARSHMFILARYTFAMRFKQFHWLSCIYLCHRHRCRHFNLLNGHFMFSSFIILCIVVCVYLYIFFFGQT